CWLTRRVSVTVIPYTTVFRSQAGLVGAGHRRGLVEQGGGDGQFAGRGGLRAQARVIGEVLTDKGGGGVAGGEFRVLEQVGEEARSEEHTSELQSRENLVCRLM